MQGPFRHVSVTRNSETSDVTGMAPKGGGRPRNPIETRRGKIGWGMGRGKKVLVWSDSISPVRDGRIELRLADDPLGPAAAKERRRSFHAPMTFS